MEEIKINIGGMHCVRCAQAVENALKSADGVDSVEVSYASNKASVNYDRAKTNIKTLGKIIKKAGYSVVTDKKEFQKKELKNSVIIFTVSAVLALPFLLMMILMFVAPEAAITHKMHTGLWQFILATPVQFVVGFRFYKGALGSLKNKSPNMDLLIALGTTVAYAYSTYNLFADVGGYYFESSVFIITLVYLGKMLEMRAKIKTSDAITLLMNLQPKKVTVLRDGQELVIDAAQIALDDIFLVRPGESVATDGTVTEGQSGIDEAMLTGESIPAMKIEGSRVFGGTVNGSGILKVKAERIGGDTKLSQIIRLVENAQSSKARIQRLADKVSAYFVPSIIIIAIITLVITYFVTKEISTAISHAVAVLVIACPCALGLATPTALMVGTGRAAGLGILIKSAESLETACNIDTVIFDKTGTITNGAPVVTDFIILDDKIEDIDKMIYALEEKSNHPLAKAVTKHFTNGGLNVDNFNELTGYGVSGVINSHNVNVGSTKWMDKLNIVSPDSVTALQKQGKTVLIFAYDNKARAVLAVADTIKQNSRMVIDALHKLNIKTVLATGDNAVTAQAIAKEAGIDEYYAEVQPENKSELVKKYQDGHIVAFVGDGINDSPALALADIGFAMGNGIDIAMESGDIVLMNGNLELVIDAIKLSKATMRKIKQNLFWAFFYNCIGIPFAAFGLLSPILAGAAMAFSSITVVSNSLLLRRSKIK